MNQATSVQGLVWNRCGNYRKIIIFKITRWTLRQRNESDIVAISGDNGIKYDSRKLKRARKPVDVAHPWYICTLILVNILIN